MIIKKPRFLILFALAVAAIAATSALTAANTVPDSKAGDGAGTISGFTISDVDYGLNASDPSLIDAVTFTLDAIPAAGSSIMMKLESAGATWYTCSNVGTAVTCDTTSPSASVASADELRVVIG